MGLFNNVDGGVTYTPGQIIFSQGDDPGGIMYVVQAGEIEIIVNGEHVDTIGEGSFLGEIGLVDNKPRTGSAIAKTECRLLSVDKKRFTFMVQQTPFFALQVLEAMAGRLRDYRAV